MNVKLSVQLISIFVVMISLPSLSGIPGIHLHGITAVRGDVAPCAGCPPPNGVSPLAQWVPAGPQMDKLVISVYTDEGSEYAGLLSNQLDLTDWPAPSSTQPTLQGDPRFYLTAPNAGFEMFDIDFNHAATLFNIAGTYGADGLTATTQAINIRQGIAHLIDKNAFIANVLGGKAQTIDNPLPPGQDVLHSGLDLTPATTPCAGTIQTGAYQVDQATSATYDPANPANVNCPKTGTPAVYNLGGVCRWDIAAGKTVAGHTVGTSCVSAFREGIDPAGSDSVGIVNAAATNVDYCDAAVHWVLAGVATSIAADCSLNGFFTATGSIRFVVRDDSAPRLALGDALAARMCQLIHGDTFSGSCAEIVVALETITVAIKDVFPACTTASCTSPNVGWGMYTAGWGLTPQYDQEWALYNSRFAGVSTGTPCNGDGSIHGQDYVHFCNARHDTLTNGVEFAVDAGHALANLQAAMEIFGNHTATIPIWSGANQFGYLKGWTGVSDAKGAGPPNTFTLLNMWNPNPVVPGTIRWGFKQGTSTLNPYNFATVQESYIITNVYDSLLKAEPYNPTSLFGWMVNGWATLNPGNTQCPTTQNDSATGVVTPVKQCIKFALRNDLSFHDGVKLTAGDVKYSFLSYKVAGGTEAPLVSAVIDVNYLDDSDFVVVLSQVGPFQLNNVGGVPMVPSHLWSLDRTLTNGQQLQVDKCTVTNQPNGACTLALVTCGPSGPICDAVSTNQLIGSGAWECVSSTGVVGGGCTSTGTDSTAAGNTITLTRFGLGQNPLNSAKAYFRSSAKYAQWQWADITGTERVNIFDAAEAGACNNKAATTTPCARMDVPGALATSITSGVPATPPALPATIPFGGASKGIVNILQVSEIFALFGVVWTPLGSEVKLYSSLSGAQTQPPTLYQTSTAYVRAPDVALGALVIPIANPIAQVYGASVSVATGGSWTNQLTSSAVAGPAFSGMASVTATSSNAPTGTTITVGSPSVVLTAGGTGTSTISVTVPAGTAVGTGFNVIECVSLPAIYTYYTVSYTGTPVTSITVTSVSVTITVTQCINVKVTVTA